MLPLSFVGAPLEMTKQRWRESMQALYESHMDPEKDEQLKRSRKDIENKLQKILKLVKDRHQNRRNRNSEVSSRKDSELIELIEDFHKQYQFVYELYDHLRGQISQAVSAIKGNIINEDEGYYTATSSSDSDSEKDVSNENSTHLNGGLHSGEPLQESIDQVVTDLKHKLAQVSDEKESLISEHMTMVNKVQETERILKKLGEESRELKAKLARKERDLSLLARTHKLRDKEASSLIKELEVELHVANHVLGSVLGIGTREQDNEPENSDLQAKFSRLEKITKKIDDELSSLISEADHKENGSVSEVNTIKGLIIQVNYLKLNADCLHNQYGEGEKNTAPKSNEELANQVNEMKDELKIMQRKNMELESQIKEKTRKNSDLEVQIENIKRDLNRKTGDLQKNKKEKEHSVVNLKKLETQMQNLSKTKREMEKRISQENDLLREETERLQEETARLEKALKEREDQFFALQKKLEDGEDLAYQVHHLQQEAELKKELEEQIKIKNGDIDKLIMEKESLKGRISELEGRISDLEITLTNKDNEISDRQRRFELVATGISSMADRISHLQHELTDEKHKSQDRLAQMEKHNAELVTKITDQQLILKQQEDAINRLHEYSRIVKGKLLQAADRKMDEVAEEFRKNLEDKLRILSQRIRVSEQLHIENKERCKRMKERCEQKHPKIETKVKELESMIQRISDIVDATVTGMESVINDFQIKETWFLQRISKVSNEIQITKNWAKWTVNEIKPWKDDSGGTAIVQEDKKESDVMKEKVWKLEEKMNKEKGDKIRLIRGMYELQKKVSELEKQVVEKDESLYRLGQEKVEAIRQLCIWIEYYHNRCDRLLKEMISIKKTRSQGRS